MTTKEKLDRLFTKPSTPFGAYPFDKIKDTDYAELIDEAIEQKREEIKTIENNPEAPSFRNTSLALEESGEALEALLGAFYNVLSADSTDILMQTAETFSEKLSSLDSDILLSQELFHRIKKLYDKQNELSLSTIEKRLLQRQYESFARNGALLSADKKEELRKVNESLSLSSLSFGNNLLKDSKLFRLYLPQNEKGLERIPKSILQLAHKRAEKERSMKGYLFSLDAPEYMAIMRYAPSEDLRKRFYFAKMQIGCQENCYNNTYLVKRIANLRLKKAQLLGYKSYADFKLENRMLNSREKVLELLNNLQEASIGKANDELNKASAIKGSTLAPWDVNFYLERLRERDYNFSEKELQPYFPLEATIKGVFGLAERLYGLSFVYDKSIPVYNKEVKAYRVEDKKREEFIGLLYLDFFPRAGKRSGAWMNNLREESDKQRPHILLVMNFNPPQEGQEALLLPSEVHTFLHEFGHSLHGLLTKVRFSSLSGTNVVHDFVELPSQINENWLTEPEFLNSFAQHYQTGETIPKDLLNRFIEADKCRTGYDTQRQLAFGFLDMDWHSIESPLGEELTLTSFEKESFSKTPAFGILPAGCAMSTSFSHLFNGGYAAGYYGYKWSEVLSTDAFSLFKEKGIFDANTASAFRENILAQGDAEDPEVLYRCFRGRDPKINALIERDGLKI